MKRPLIVLAAVLSLSSIGCASFTSFQTARAMDAGNLAVEVAAAGIALGAGVETAVRMRGGLGRGFETGVGMGVNSSGFSPVLMSADLKWQFLRQNDKPAAGEAEMPLSAAVGLGAGYGLFSEFYFLQATASRQFDWIEPYFTYRFQFVDLMFEVNDAGDRNDLADSIMSEIFEKADRTDIRLHHFFFGARVNVGSGFYLVPEFSLLAGDASGLGSIGVAAGYELKW